MKIRRDRRIAGIGGVVFALSLVMGFTFFGPRGGFYAASAMTSFVGQSSTNVIVSFYLFAVSVTGLILLMQHLTETFLGEGRHARVVWGTSLLAAASFLIGWGLYFPPFAAVTSGGPAIDPGITYVFLSAGFVVLFGVSGMLLGIALVTLAIGQNVAPIWVRALSGLAGVSAASLWGFNFASHWSPNQWLPVPFYIVILWALVIGVWLFVTAPNTRPP